MRVARFDEFKRARSHGSQPMDMNQRATDAGTTPRDTVRAPCTKDKATTPKEMSTTLSTPGRDTENGEHAITQEQGTVCLDTGHDARGERRGPWVLRATRIREIGHTGRNNGNYHVLAPMDIEAIDGEAQLAW